MTLFFLSESIAPHWSLDWLPLCARKVRTHSGDQGVKIATLPVTYGQTSSIVVFDDGAMLKTLSCISDEGAG
jgi:hypothetical protein